MPIWIPNFFLAPFSLECVMCTLRWAWLQDLVNIASEHVNNGFPPPLIMSVHLSVCILFIHYCACVYFLSICLCVSCSSIIVYASIFCLCLSICLYASSSSITVYVSIFCLSVCVYPVHPLLCMCLFSVYLSVFVRHYHILILRLSMDKL